MTLDKAIERYTNNAEYERIHGNLQGCLDFRQLAEWLKDYKRLLEQEPFINKTCVSEKQCEHDKNVVIGKIRAEIEQKIEQERFARAVFRGEEKDAVKAEQCTGSIFAYNNVIKLIDKYKAESEDKE